jgi:hypothetical protein
VPIALVALGLVAWAVLSGLPFNREPRTPEPRQMEVVEEREVSTTTVAEIRDREPEPPRRSGEVGESVARQALAGYLAGNGLSQQCASIDLVEYKNRGYTYTVRDRCDDQSLGRWRVDSEDPSGIFRQRADGRYLRP